MFYVEPYGYGKFYMVAFYMVVMIYMVVVSTYISEAVVYVLYIPYIIYDCRLGILYYDYGKVVM